ncbi:MAG: transcription termination factor NusA [Candidatus Kuenenbacteria bacterium]
MASELTQAIQQVCDDKKISLESVVSTIESALAAAYRKDFGEKTQNIKVKFNMETGGFKVYDVKEAVENELKEQYEKMKEERAKAAEEGIELPKEEPMENEEVKKFNPKTMIALSEAKEIKKSIKLGENLVQELGVPGDFGRMAAQTAKQVIIQKLREAERDTIFEEYKDKQGELINGIIQRREGGVFLVEMGNVTAIMPMADSVQAENYQPGKSFKFYIKTVEQTPKGPEVVVSRNHPEIIRKLFKLEVPEISAGTVQIKSIAREAGSRSKVAVMTKEDNIDPIGSAVGQRGTRVQTVINELGGEKIDIIEWDEEPAKFIAKALSPAKVNKVEIKEHKNTGDETKSKGSKKSYEKTKQGNISVGREAVVYVNADQLSLAIGKEGQNVRLAAKLTGWKIDIVGEKVMGEKKENEGEEVIQPKNNKKGTINKEQGGEKKDNKDNKEGEETKVEDKKVKEKKKEDKKEKEEAPTKDKKGKKKKEKDEKEKD